MPKMFSSSKCFQFTSIIAAVILVCPLIVSPFNVIIHVPSAVERGKEAILVCLPELFNDEIHRVTWFKDGLNIYRFKPSSLHRERESFRVNNGVTIDTKASNITHLILTDVSIASEGNYTCQVESIGPNFAINRNTSELRVYSVPKDFKNIVRIHQDDPTTRSSDLMCVSAATHPETHLHWLIDGQPVQSNRIVDFPIERTYDNLKISKSRLLDISEDELGKAFTCQGIIRFNKFHVKASSQLTTRRYNGNSRVESATHETLDEFGEEPFDDNWNYHSESFKSDKKKKSKNSSYLSSSSHFTLINLIIYFVLFNLP